MTTIPAEQPHIPGLCFLCHQEVVPTDAPSHTRGCADKARSHDDHVMLMSVRTKEHPHWLELALKPDATLTDLADFLQRVWVDYPEHPSNFFISLQTDPSEQPGPLVQADHHFLHQPIEEILDHESQLEYRCNQTHATAIQLACSGSSPISYEHVKELLGDSMIHGSRATYTIVVIARNHPLERCEKCGTPAHWQYYQRSDSAGEQEGNVPLAAPHFFCEDCVPDDGLLVLVKNSPQVETTCYYESCNEPEEADRSCPPEHIERPYRA